ncbi:restriction endonuclease subunit S [Thermanaerothrix sp.]|uniref:restriction endonuclease subunit S n=1 Tax=Thermanaerothrix sp. TaxID=2972675 RepID=UPI003C7BDEAE
MATLTPIQKNPERYKEPFSSLPKNMVGVLFNPGSFEAEERRKQALGELFKTLLSHLMTGKIRVNHLIKENEEEIS